MSEVATIVVHPAIKVVIEQEGDAWGAYAPSIPGCGAAGDSREEVERLIEEALTFHLEALHEDGQQRIAEMSQQDTAKEVATDAAQRL